MPMPIPRHGSRLWRVTAARLARFRAGRDLTDATWWTLLLIRLRAWFWTRAHWHRNRRHARRPSVAAPPPRGATLA